MLNVVRLSEGSVFAPSPTIDVLKLLSQQKNGANVMLLWQHMRSEYASFVAQEQAKEGYDNTLTCYYKTNDRLAEDLGVHIRTIEKAMADLQKLGLLILLPFTKNGKERHNIIALDSGLRDYKAIVSECIKRLEKLIAESRRAKKAQKQLNFLLPITSEDTPDTPDTPITEPVSLPSPPTPPVSRPTEDLDYSFNPFSY